jgi:hypothetical protein
MKIFGFILLGCLFATILSAQTPDSTKLWNKGGVGSLNFNQVSFSNWAAGGENSISVGAYSNLFAKYKKDKTTWDNSLDLAYGLNKIGDAPLRKNDDKIDLNSKYGHLAFNKWYYSALVNFKSQFADGYNYPNDSVVVSAFMSPAYILLSIGMDYKPNDYFSFYFSPATGKITIVNDQNLADNGAYGVDSGKTHREEFGAYIAFAFKKEIMKNATFGTKLDMFSNYSHNPQNIDVNWDAMLALKVNKYITANISTTLIYDDDIDVPIMEEINGLKTQVGVGPRTQFKEVIGIGLSYKF